MPHSLPHSAAQAVLPLINLAYEAALEPSRWPDFLQQFGRLLRSPACLIWAHDFSAQTSDLHGSSPDGHGFGVITGVDASAIASFEAHYGATNVWLQDPQLHRAGSVVHSSALFCDRQLQRTEWYGDWLQPQDLFYSCAAVVEHAHERSFNVTALRSPREGGYTAHELQCVQLLVPHLKTAFELHRRLQRTQALASGALAMLEQLPLGVVLLGAQGQVLHVNARAHSLVQDSPLIRIVQHRVQAFSAAAEQWLQAAIAQTVGMAGVMARGAGTVLPLSGHNYSGAAQRWQHWSGAQLQVMVAPLPLASQPYGMACAAALVLSDPAQSVLALASVLCSYYRMTPAEAKLVEGLINGLSPQEYADAQGLSIHTVRSHFKSAASKAGVSRQADLVRVVLMGPALLRWQQAREGWPERAQEQLLKPSLQPQS